MTMTMQEAEVNKQKVAKYLSIQKPDDHLFCSEYDKKSEIPRNFLINLDEMKRLQVRRQETKHRWDYLTTFKPPQHVSIESG